MMQGLQFSPSSPPIRAGEGAGGAADVGNYVVSPDEGAEEVWVEAAADTASKPTRQIRRMSVQDNVYTGTSSHPDVMGQEFLTAAGTAAVSGVTSVDDQPYTELLVSLHDESVEIIHEGFMSKRGYYRRNYLKRWFVAYGKPKNYLLEYYDVKGGRLKGRIELLD